MPDVTIKRIDELPAAESIGQNDLLAIEQGDVAKKLTTKILYDLFGDSQNILFNGRPSVEGEVSDNGDSQWGFFRGDQSENIEIIPIDGFKFTIPSGVSAENARFQLQKYLIYPNKVFPYLAGEFLTLNGGDVVSASLEIKTPIKLAEVSVYFSGKDGNSENLEKAYFFNVEQNSTNNEWVTISGSVAVPTWWDNAKQQINTSRAGIIFVIRSDTDSFDATQQHIIWVRNIQIAKGTDIGNYGYSAADIDYIVDNKLGASDVDSALSSSSENPVQNKVVKNALDSKASTSSLANKADKITEVTVSTNGAVTQELDVNVLYHFTGSLTSLTITLESSLELNSYHFDFDSGSTAPTLSLPQTVVMPSGFSVEANKHYEIDILNNYGAVMSWANS